MQAKSAITSTPGERRSAALRMVVLAQVISTAGSGISSVALPLLVFRGAGILATGLVFVVVSLPGLLFGLHAGALADRFNRKTLVVAGNLIQGTLMAGTPVTYREFGVTGVAVLAFSSRTFGVFASPATSAALPELAGERYQQLLGKVTALNFLAQAVGPALGGALAGLVGAPDAILGDAASFIVAGALIATIPSFDKSRATRRAERAASPMSTTRDLLSGLAYTWRNPVLRGLLIYWSVSIAAVPIALVAAIPYVTRVLGASSLDYGVAVSCYAVGSIAGSLISGKLGFRGGKRAWLLAAGLTYGAVNVVILGRPPFLAFCLLWAIWGISYGPEEVITQLIFAQSVPDSMRGRAYSVAGIVMSTASIIGYLAGGELAAHAGAMQTMAIAGYLFIAASIWSFGFSALARAIPRLDDRQAGPADNQKSAP
jgi:MFS family permease